MLDNLPHDQAFSQLVISQMRTYYDRLYNYYKGKLIVPRTHGTATKQLSAQVSRTLPDSNAVRVPKRAAGLAEKGDICNLVIELLRADDTQTPELVVKVSRLPRMVFVGC